MSDAKLTFMIRSLALSLVLHKLSFSSPSVEPISDGLLCLEVAILTSARVLPIHLST